mgnify:CR=1 FL=1
MRSLERCKQQNRVTITRPCQLSAAVRFIRVKNWKLGLIYYLTTVAILMYVIIFQIILEKGYDSHVNASLMRSNALQISRVRPADGHLLCESERRRRGWHWRICVRFASRSTLHTVRCRKVFDSNDLVLPAAEQNAVFITTNFIETHNQTRGVCEGADKQTERCSPDGKWCTIWTITGSVVVLRCASKSRWREDCQWRDNRSLRPKEILHDSRLVPA